MTQLLLHSGASKVLISEPRPHRREICKAVGGNPVDPKNQDLAAFVKDQTGGLGPEIVFDCLGHPALLEQGIDLVQKGGTVFVMGVADPEAIAKVRPFQLFDKEITDQGRLPAPVCLPPGRALAPAPRPAAAPRRGVSPGADEGGHPGPPGGQGPQDHGEAVGRTPERKPQMSGRDSRQIIPDGIPRWNLRNLRMLLTGPCPHATRDDPHLRHRHQRLQGLPVGRVRGRSSPRPTRRIRSTTRSRTGPSRTPRTGGGRAWRPPAAVSPARIPVASPSWGCRPSGRASSPWAGMGRPSPAASSGWTAAAGIRLRAWRRSSARRSSTTITGLAPDPNYTACKLLWVREHQPDLIDRAATFLQTRDYVYYRLTGELVTDYTLASRTMMLDLRRHTWWPDIFRRIGVRQDQFPPIYRSTDAPYRLSRMAAEALGLPAGIPVSLGRRRSGLRGRRHRALRAADDRLGRDSQQHLHGHRPAAR